MADDQYRGLLTDREKEILSGEADVSDSYQYRTVSRVRNKIEQINIDYSFLLEHNPELAEELEEAVTGK